VNDQETEKTALCSKVGTSSQRGADRKKKIASAQWYKGKGKFVPVLNELSTTP
jgi:hypothetical protein